MLAEVTVVIDRYPIQKDPHSLIGGGEKKALVCPRIGRNVDANPDVVRPLGYGDTKLWLNFRQRPSSFEKVGTLLAARSSASDVFDCQYSHKSSEVSAETGCCAQRKKTQKNSCTNAHNLRFIFCCLLSELFVGK